MSFRRDVIYNMAGNGLPLLVAVIAIPYTLQHLGKEGFGVLTLVWAVIGYMGVLDLGVGRALTFALARTGEPGKPSPEKARILVSGFVLSVLLGALGALLVYAGLTVYFGKFLEKSGVDASVIHQVCLYSALGALPTTVNSALRGALEGERRFFASNTNRLVFGSLMFGSPALGIALGDGSLGTITALLIGSRVLVCFLSAFDLRGYWAFRARPSVAEARALTDFGLWVTLSNVLSPLMAYGDRFIVGAIVGLAQVTIYSIPQEGLGRLLLIPIAISGALVPRMAAAATEDLRSIYRKNLVNTMKIMAPVVLIAAALAQPALALWISPEFARESLPVVFVLLFGIFWNSAAQIPFAALHATGRPRQAALCHLLELPLFLAAAWALTSAFGAVGAGIAWSLRVTLDFALMHFLSWRGLPAASPAREHKNG